MSKKLNQVLATEKGIKTRVYARLTQLHKETQTAALLEGSTRNYQPLAEDGTTFPAEAKKVQINSDDVFLEVSRMMADLFDITAQKDWANQTARADVVVDGEVLIKDVPPTFLLFLAKQLTDLYNFVDKFVELKSEIDWSRDETTGLYKSEPVTTHKTEKVQKPIMLAPATEHHPAQTQMITQDQTVGHWKAVHFSGALSRPRKTILKERIQKVLRAVKESLETANMVPAADKTIGESFFKFLFAP